MIYTQKENIFAAGTFEGLIFPSLANVTNGKTTNLVHRGIAATVDKI